MFLTFSLNSTCSELLEQPLERLPWHRNQERRLRDLAVAKRRGRDQWRADLAKDELAEPAVNLCLLWHIQGRLSPFSLGGWSICRHLFRPPTRKIRSSWCCPWGSRRQCAFLLVIDSFEIRCLVIHRPSFQANVFPRQTGTKLLSQRLQPISGSMTIPCQVLCLKHDLCALCPAAKQ